mmetsp:Transcript_10259/g.34870  ORF Transcript_10259/g.34870 Transcript_10259/m.34870 type:complete len:244 (+) Transcript_10259:733-1464(+)
MLILESFRGLVQLVPALVARHAGSLDVPVDQTNRRHGGLRRPTFLERGKLVVLELLQHGRPLLAIGVEGGVLEAVHYLRAIRIAPVLRDVDGGHLHRGALAALRVVRIRRRIAVSHVLVRVVRFVRVIRVVRVAVRVAVRAHLRLGRAAIEDVRDLHPPYPGVRESSGGLEHVEGVIVVVRSGNSLQQSASREPREDPATLDTHGLVGDEKVARPAQWRPVADVDHGLAGARQLLLPPREQAV